MYLPALLETYFGESKVPTQVAVYLLGRRPFSPSSSREVEFFTADPTLNFAAVLFSFLVLRWSF